MVVSKGNRMVEDFRHDWSLGVWEFSGCWNDDILQRADISTTSQCLKEIFLLQNRASLGSVIALL